jgi:transcriptional regulator with XRE-family HTH domain
MTNGIEKLMETVGKRISDLIDSKWEGSQEELAALLSVHQTHVSAMKRGARFPSVPVLASLANILETNTDYLLGLTDDDKPSSDLDDQVLVTVRDPEEKALFHELFELLRKKPLEEQRLILDMVRLTVPRAPRIIGGKE